MKTVRIQDNPETSDATHWETCRHDSCIEHQCPRYDRCCGEVAKDIYVGDTPCSMCLNNPGRVTSK